jgi:hypothetical protein
VDIELLDGAPLDGPLDGAPLDGCAGVEAAADVGAADVDVVVVPPPHPDNSAARANADKPMLRFFFIAAP